MAKRKKKEEDGVEKGDPSVVLFLALMIILLAFFIMLSSMAVQDDQRTRAALGSLLGQFGIVPRGAPAGSTSPMSSGAGIGAYPEVRELQSLQNTLMGDRDLPGDIAVDAIGDDIRVILSGDLGFGPGEIALSGYAGGILKRLSGKLNKVQRKVRIEGHAADAAEEAEQFPNLWEVSMKRSLSTANALMSFNVAEGRLIVAGYGTTRPLYANDSPGNRARNRRVEITVIGGAQDTALWRESRAMIIDGIRIEEFWKKWTTDDEKADGQDNL